MRPLSHPCSFLSRDLLGFLFPFLAPLARGFLKVVMGFHLPYCLRRSHFLSFYSGSPVINICLLSQFTCDCRLPRPAFSQQPTAQLHSHTSHPCLQHLCWRGFKKGFQAHFCADLQVSSVGLIAALLSICTSSYLPFILCTWQDSLLAAQPSACSRDLRSHISV